MEVAPESQGTLPFMESQPPSSQKCRTRILHTFGLSLLTIAHKAYKRAEGIHCPGVSPAHKLASLAGPILHFMQCQLLAILSLADDQILSIENMIEALFPSSAYVFNKIDSLAPISETLPRKFDSFVDHFITMIHQIPPLNWAMIHLCATLKFLVLTLTDWACDGAREVREITVHVNRDEHTNEMGLREHPTNPNRGPHVKRSRPMSNSMNNGGDEDDDLTAYEVIKSVSNDTGDKEDDDEMACEKRVLQVNDEAKAQVSENSDMFLQEEPILELFDEGWHMRPLRKK